MITERQIEKLAKELGLSSITIGEFSHSIGKRFERRTYEDFGIIEDIASLAITALLKRIEAEERTEVEGWQMHSLVGYFCKKGRIALFKSGDVDYAILDKAEVAIGSIANESFTPAEPTWLPFPENRPEEGQAYWVTYINGEGYRTVRRSIFGSGGFIFGVIAFMPYDAERKPALYQGPVPGGE